jgi:hypothetical protein
MLSSSPIEGSTGSWLGQMPAHPTIEPGGEEVIERGLHGLPA